MDIPPDSLERLRAAEQRALELIQLITPHIRPGQNERELSERFLELAASRFGTRRYWHKRVVRAGANTLLPYADNPPVHVLGADDIMFFDMGPVFAEWEADVGRTHVLGDDPSKHAIAAAGVELWRELRDWALPRAGLTAGELYRELERRATLRGWPLGHWHCGHLVGRFPHEELEGDDRDKYLHADNPTPLASRGVSGEPYRWILEVHLVDRPRGFGSFHESLLV